MHRFSNVSCSKEVIDIYPKGFYRALVTGQDNVDPKIFQINMTFSIKS